MARAHVNTYFGDGSFDSMGNGDQDIVKLVAVLGDVHPLAHANVGELKVQGEIAYMKRVHGEYLSHQIFESFDDNAKRVFRNHGYLFEWKDTVTGEIYRDGPTLLLLALQRLRPDTVVDIYKKIEAIKALKLSDFGLNLSLLIDSFNEKRDEIQDMDRYAYAETQVAADMFRIFSFGAPEAFKKWVEAEHMKWATGETPFNAFTLQERATKVFTNLSSDGRWKKEFSSKDQIIALTTKIGTLEQAMKNSGGGGGGSGGGGGGGGPKQNPPTAPGGPNNDKFGTVEPWRLEHKGKSITHSGKVWYWCTKGHKFQGKVVDMYVSHLEVDHDFWQKYNKCDTAQAKTKMMDERNERKRKFNTAAGTDDGQRDNSKSKRMVMDSKMKEAFCTQSGMSESQVEAILKSCEPK